MQDSGTDRQRDRAPATVGERIKARREERGLSLSRLADAAGVSKSYLHELEANASVKPSAEVLYGVALALETTIAHLLGRQPLGPEAEVLPVEIPPELERFARKARITEEDKRRLACIKYRGHQPKTEADWEYLYETIKRVVGS